MRLRPKNLNCRVESRRRRECALNSQLVHDGFGRNMSRIYPVELVAELETGSRLPRSEYTPPDTTQLDSTCSVFSFSTKCVGSRRELELSRVGGVY